MANIKLLLLVLLLLIKVLCRVKFRYCYVSRSNILMPICNKRNNVNISFIYHYVTKYHRCQLLITILVLLIWMWICNGIHIMKYDTGCNPFLQVCKNKWACHLWIYHNISGPKAQNLSQVHIVDINMLFYLNPLIRWFQSN